MHLVVVRKTINLPDTSLGESGYIKNNSGSLLRLAFSLKPLASIVIKEMSQLFKPNKEGLSIVIPEDWKQVDADSSDSMILFYQSKVNLPAFNFQEKSWLVLSNGRFIARTDFPSIFKSLESIGSDVLAVNVGAYLRAGREKVLIDSDKNLVGFRLLYADSINPSPLPNDWPHHLFIKSSFVGKILPDGILPDNFNEFINKCRACSAAISGLDISGIALDLASEHGLLSLLSMQFKNQDIKPFGFHGHKAAADKNNSDISPRVRLFGDFALGRNIRIAADTVIVGPAIIGDNSSVAEKAVIRESIIGPNVSVPAGAFVHNRVITDSNQITAQLDIGKCSISDSRSSDELLNRGPYRAWPYFSYARFFKRIIDFLVSAIVLVVFIPVIPLLAMIVKLGSKGPVFFRDRRQGLHGKAFLCPKFRTMKKDAAKLQEKLRGLNEADGPQFVIADDPRLSKVGRFLRETYLDEIPQFWAVLMGHMSIVGPRPSPESENVLCPFWRDARLSVRPGVTGLWQVRRTRRPMKDFQEWIHYDIEYVRNLSVTLDLWICWQTFKKMIINLVRQF